MIEDEQHDAFTTRVRVVWLDGQHDIATDPVTREEPLEIRIRGVPIAVVMRTPGHDIDLVTGFVTTEGIAIPSAIRRVRHCDVWTNSRDEDSVVLVDLDAHAPFHPEQLRRNLFASSSCGVCGKASLDHALAHAGPIQSDVSIPARQIATWPAQLRARQEVFEATGGIHAAALFDETGQLLSTREDVGRHNAVDKVIGWMIRTGATPAAGLMVSGRISFEIVQKATAARIPIIAAVSAPTSLACDLAERSNIALAGFVRDGRMCIYTHPHRIPT